MTPNGGVACHTNGRAHQEKTRLALNKASIGSAEESEATEVIEEIGQWLPVFTFRPLCYLTLLN
jgi:hypothetical protein